jgi:hypothetical protein
MLCKINGGEICKILTIKNKMKYKKTKNKNHKTIGNGKIKTKTEKIKWRQTILHSSIYDLCPQNKTQRATLCSYYLIDLQYKILLFIGELR